MGNLQENSFPKLTNLKNPCTRASMPLNFDWPIQLLELLQVITYA